MKNNIENNVVGSIKVHGSTPKAKKSRRKWQIHLARCIQGEYAKGATVKELMEVHGYGRSMVYNYINMEVGGGKDA